MECLGWWPLASEMLQLWQLQPVALELVGPGDSPCRLRLVVALRALSVAGRPHPIPRVALAKQTEQFPVLPLIPFPCECLFFCLPFHFILFYYYYFLNFIFTLFYFTILYWFCHTLT